MSSEQERKRELIEEMVATGACSRADASLALDIGFNAVHQALKTMMNHCDSAPCDTTRMLATVVATKNMKAEMDVALAAMIQMVTMKIKEQRH